MKELFQGITGKARTILFIEFVVGVLILLGGIFLLAYEGKAPVISPSAIATPEFSTYISSPLQITLKYPYGWSIDPTFNGIPGIERYSGADGFFEVGATNNSKAPKGSIVKKFPKPIILGETKYTYFLLKADEDHLQSIADSVEFL